MTLLPEFRAQLVSAARQRAQGRPGAGNRSRIGRLVATTPTLLAVLLAAAVAIGAIVAVGHGRSPARVGVPPASSLRELVQTLGVLRRPQTASDRRSMRARISQGGALPELFEGRALLPRLCQGRPATFPPCAQRLERGLVRVVNLPGSRYRAAIFPTTSVKLRRAGVLLTFRGPGVYFAQSGPIPASTSALREHGVAVFDYAAPGVDRGVILVPDGVSNVELAHFRLLAPTRERLRHVAPTISPVTENVALIRLAGVTDRTLRLDLQRLGRYFHQGSGRYCRTTLAIYAVPATARMTWRDGTGAVIRRSTISLLLYVGARFPPPDATPRSPRCGG